MLQHHLDIFTKKSFTNLSAITTVFFMPNKPALTSHCVSDISSPFYGGHDLHFANIYIFYDKSIVLLS